MAQQQPPQQHHQNQLPYGTGSPIQHSPSISPSFLPNSHNQPPNKRPRISPHPTYTGSPYGTSPVTNSPQLQNANLPQYSPQFSQSSIQSPPPQAQLGQFQLSNGISTPTTMGGVHAGSMGPPSRPPEKDKDDYDDVLAGSGVDLRAEEEVLFTSFNASASFNSGGTAGSQSTTLSQGNSFNNASQYGQAIEPPGPHFTGPPSANEKPEELFAREWKEKARQRAISKQHHLQQPFTNLLYLSNKFKARGHENGVHLPQDGYRPQMSPLLYKDINENEPGKFKSVEKIGPDGTQMMVVTGGLVERDARFGDMMALLSLATAERVRGLVEDAASIARGRRQGAQGDVPAEWSDLAVGEPIATQNGVRAGWENAVSPLTNNPLKRSLSSSKLPTPDSFGTRSPINPPPKVQQFKNHLTHTLRDLSTKERDFEEDRLKKRARRAAGGISGSATPAPGTPGGGSSIAPDQDSGRKMTKKEALKNRSMQSEAEAHKTSNITANIMLGSGRLGSAASLFGGKKKEYSWLAGGGRSGTGTPGTMTPRPAGLGAPTRAAEPARLTMDSRRRFGDWREDGEKAAGIQLRDWVTVLEQDGKEKKALAKAYAMLGSEGR